MLSNSLTPCWLFVADAVMGGGEEEAMLLRADLARFRGPSPHSLPFPSNDSIPRTW